MAEELRKLGGMIILGKKKKKWTSGDRFDRGESIIEKSQSSRHRTLPGLYEGMIRGKEWRHEPNYLEEVKKKRAKTVKI